MARSQAAATAVTVAAASNPATDKPGPIPGPMAARPGSQCKPEVTNPQAGCRPGSGPDRAGAGAGPRRGSGCFSMSGALAGRRAWTPRPGPARNSSLRRVSQQAPVAESESVAAR